MINKVHWNSVDKDLPYLDLHVLVHGYWMFEHLLGHELFVYFNCKQFGTSPIWFLHNAGYSDGWLASATDFVYFRLLHGTRTCHNWNCMRLLTDSSFGVITCWFSKSTRRHSYKWNGNPNGNDQISFPKAILTDLPFLPINILASAGGDYV